MVLLESGSRCGGTVIGGRREHRPLIQSSHVIGDESRGAEPVVENFHLNLPAVRVPGKRSSMPNSAARLNELGL